MSRGPEPIEISIVENPDDGVAVLVLLLDSGDAHCLGDRRPAYRAATLGCLCAALLGAREAHSAVAAGEEDRVARGRVTDPAWMSRQGEREAGRLVTGSRGLPAGAAGSGLAHVRTR